MHLTTISDFKFNIQYDIANVLYVKLQIKFMLNPIHVL